MVKSRPLLQHIGLRNAGIRLKFLKSTQTGEAVWGKINGEIQGQLKQAFNEEEAIQNKLTAFVVIPKDSENLALLGCNHLYLHKSQKRFAALKLPS